LAWDGGRSSGGPDEDDFVIKPHFFPWLRALKGKGKNQEAEKTQPPEAMATGDDSLEAEVPEAELPES
jgi:hypothetical protein